MSLILNTKAVIKQIDNFLFDLTHSLDLTKSADERLIMKEISEKGYFVVDQAFTKEWCKEICDEIDRLIVEYKDQINVDREGSDHRIYGANSLSDKIKEFYTNSLSNRILQSYNKIKYRDGFTLAAKLLAVESNRGSGGGWHRDTAFERQTKAILYLSDVRAENGPFQYIEGSHRVKNLYKHQLKYGIGLGQNRIADEVVNNIVSDDEQLLKTFYGNTGTIILVDTRGIHRGKPIESGERYALTNYNWVRKEIPQHVKKLIVTG